MNQQCREVLLNQNRTIVNQSRAAQLIHYSMVNREYYERNGGSVGLGYSGANLDFSEFQEQLTKEKQEMGLYFSEEEAFSASTAYTPTAAINAWRDCMLANGNGLFCNLEGSLDDIILNLRVTWEPPIGLTDLEIKGVSINDDSNLFGSSMGEFPRRMKRGSITIPIKRESPTITVRGHINGQAGEGFYTASFFIPKVIQIPREDPWYLSDFPEKIIQGSVLNVHGGLTLNYVYWQPNDPIIIGEVPYNKGIGMHPPVNGTATAAWRIPTGYKWFHSIFGMAKQGDSTVYGEAAGRIYIDDVQVWSGKLSGYSQTKVSVPLHHSAKVLRLVTDSLGSNWSDHTTWANAHFSNKSNF